jgi:hypothetical protein
MRPLFIGWQAAPVLLRAVTALDQTIARRLLDLEDKL